MASLIEQRVETEVLVIGAGGAGCFAAIKAHEKGAKVIVVNKVPWLGGCTLMARAGYSAAMGLSDPRDNVAAHVRDSLRGGGYMGSEKVLQAACRNNLEATRLLLQWGADFRKGPDGKLDQGKKGSAGHAYPRAVRVAGEFSHIGKAIMDPLQRQMRERRIPVMGNIMITRLLTSEGAVTGAVGYDWREGKLLVFRAKAVIVATGGTGRLYKYTDNPTYMTGDGHAAIARAGAELVDMEFCDFQLAAFYPPRIHGYPPNCGVWMLNGGILLNRHGERFFKKYFPNRADEGACLRTEINKAAAWEILEGRGSENGMVYLNCSAVPREWMMTARADMVSHFLRAGVDLTWQPMEVAPANHTWLGGMRVDENGESPAVRGLYAAGEAAGGWGGSNRLGGNAVAAALGLGIAAGESAAAKIGVTAAPKIDESQVAAEQERVRELFSHQEGVRPSEVKVRIQETMQQHLWLKREEKGLKAALKELEKIESDDLPRLCVPRGRADQRLLWLREALEAANLTLCGRLAAAAAIARTESRGSHQRVDYPETDNERWLQNVVLRQEKGKVKVRTEPVAISDGLVAEAKSSRGGEV